MTAKPNYTYLVVCAHEPDNYIAETVTRYGADKLITDLIGGQFSDPLRVIALDLSDREAKAGIWVDVSADVAKKVVEVADANREWLTTDTEYFCSLYTTVPYSITKEASDAA